MVLLAKKAALVHVATGASWDPKAMWEAKATWALLAARALQDLAATRYMLNYTTVT